MFSKRFCFEKIGDLDNNLGPSLLFFLEVFDSAMLLSEAGKTTLGEIRDHAHPTQNIVEIVATNESLRTEFLFLYSMFMNPATSSDFLDSGTFLNLRDDDDGGDSNDDDLGVLKDRCCLRSTLLNGDDAVLHVGTKIPNAAHFLTNDLSPWFLALLTDCGYYATEDVEKKVNYFPLLAAQPVVNHRSAVLKIIDDFEKDITNSNNHPPVAQMCFVGYKKERDSARKEITTAPTDDSIMSATDYVIPAKKKANRKGLVPLVKASTCSIGDALEFFLVVVSRFDVVVIFYLLLL